MKHCNKCQRSEPQVIFYANSRTECRECLSDRRRSCHRRAIAFYQISTKLKQDERENMLTKIKNEELALIDQANRNRYKVMKLDYLPLFSSTYHYLDAIGTRY